MTFVAQVKDEDMGITAEETASAYQEKICMQRKELVVVVDTSALQVVRGPQEGFLCVSASHSRAGKEDFNNWETKCPCTNQTGENRKSQAKTDKQELS